MREVFESSCRRIKQDKEEDLDLFTKNALFNDDITKYLKDSILIN